MYLMLFSSNNNIYSAWSKPYKWVINFTLVVNCLSSEQNHFPLKIHHIAPDVDKKYMYTKKNDELKLPTKNWISTVLNEWVAVSKNLTKQSELQKQLQNFCNWLSDTVLYLATSLPNVVLYIAPSCFTA